jgi:4-hydroxy-4-methyl-2-oxoglutarate aldolase
MDSYVIRDRFLTLTTAHVADAAVALGADLRFAGTSIGPLYRPIRAAGRALPVVHFGSVDVFFEAMSIASPGDILVIDNRGRGDEACIGDLTAAEAVAFGIGAMAVWGAHRDTAELKEIALPIFSTGVCPAGPRGARPRTSPPLPESITFGEAVVSRQDAFFGDDDGIVFIPLADAARVLDRAAQIARTERQQRRDIAKGVNLHVQFEWDLYQSRRATNPAYTLREHLQSLHRAIET